MTLSPIFYTEIENLVVDETTQHVAIKWKTTGTQRGEFMGFKPTGNNIHFSGIEIIRLEKGLIIERWGEWDGIESATPIEKRN
jgi:predicted ester cyclase